MQLLLQHDISAKHKFTVLYATVADHVIKANNNDIKGTTFIVQVKLLAISSPKQCDCEAYIVNQQSFSTQERMCPRQVTDKN